MGNQRTPGIRAGVRSQSSKDVLLFFLSSPGTWYPWQLQLYSLSADSGEKKVDLISYRCFSAVIQLEKSCLHKINSGKHFFFGVLDEMPVLAVPLLGPLAAGDGDAGLCWPCAHTTAPDLLLQWRNESEERSKL